MQNARVVWVSLTCTVSALAAVAVARDADIQHNPQRAAIDRRPEAWHPPQRPWPTTLEWITAPATPAEARAPQPASAAAVSPAVADAPTGDPYAAAIKHYRQLIEAEAWQAALELAVTLPPSIRARLGPMEPIEALAARQDARDALARGDLDGAVAAAELALRKDPSDPWNRLLVVQVLSRSDPQLARARASRLLEGSYESPALTLAVAYLWLDLGELTKARRQFEQIASDESEYPKAIEGRAVIAFREGEYQDAEALLDVLAARGELTPETERLRREARYLHALRRFDAAMQARDLPAASSAYNELVAVDRDHLETLRASALLAWAEGDLARAERQLRTLTTRSPDDEAANEALAGVLIATQRGPQALAVARRLDEPARARLGSLPQLERRWLPHLEAALEERFRQGSTGLDELDHLRAGISLRGSALGRAFAIALIAEELEAGRPATDSAFGTLPLTPPADLPEQRDSGTRLIMRWHPRSDLRLDIGTTPLGFLFEDLTAEISWQTHLTEAEMRISLERAAVTDSVLSYAGAADPVTGIAWGGVRRSRAFLDISRGTTARGVYATAGLSHSDGRGVPGNTGWDLSLGGWRELDESSMGTLVGLLNLTSFGFEEDLSHFTLGHGGYYSPAYFINIGPGLELTGARDSSSWRVNGRIAYQWSRESGNDYFPGRSDLQAASGGLRYASKTSSGVGAQLEARWERSIGARTALGLSGRASTGVDYDEWAVQLYVRHWLSGLAQPRNAPPRIVLDRDGLDRQ